MNIHENPDFFYFLITTTKHTQTILDQLLEIILFNFSSAPGA